MYYWIDIAGALRRSQTLEQVPSYVDTVFNKDGVILWERK